MSKQGFHCTRTSAGWSGSPPAALWQICLSRAVSEAGERACKQVCVCRKCMRPAYPLPCTASVLQLQCVVWQATVKGVAACSTLAVTCGLAILLWTAGKPRGLRTSCHSNRITDGVAVHICCGCMAVGGLCWWSGRLRVVAGCLAVKAQPYPLQCHLPCTFDPSRSW